MAQSRINLSTYPCGGNLLSINNASEKPIAPAEWTAIKPQYMKHDDLDDMDCFDMPSAWYISFKNAEYLKSKGYALFLNGMEWALPTWVEEEKRRTALQKAAEERRIAQQKKAEEERQQVQAAYDAKVAEYIANLAQIPDLFQSEYDVIPETIIYAKVKRGPFNDGGDYIAKIRIPSLGCEGVVQYFDIYDMWTYIYYVPAAFVEKHGAFRAAQQERVKKIQEDRDKVWRAEQAERQKKALEQQVQQKAEQDAKDAARAAKMPILKAELGAKVKEELLMKYAAYVGTTIQKSWSKGKIIEALAIKLCSDRPEPSSPAKKAKLEEREYPDYE